jgi:hypothetical protein
MRNTKNYLALGHDIEENFFFIKIGLSDDPEERVSKLRMKLLHVWENIWITDGDYEGGVKAYSCTVEAFFLKTMGYSHYTYSNHKFSGSSDCIGKFKTKEEALFIGRQMVKFILSLQYD